MPSKTYADIEGYLPLVAGAETVRRLNKRSPIIELVNPLLPQPPDIPWYWLDGFDGDSGEPLNGRTIWVSDGDYDDSFTWANAGNTLQITGSGQARSTETSGGNKITLGTVIPQTGVLHFAFAGNRGDIGSVSLTLSKSDGSYASMGIGVTEGLDDTLYFEQFDGGSTDSVQGLGVTDGSTSFFLDVDVATGEYTVTTSDTEDAGASGTLLMGALAGAPSLTMTLHLDDFDSRAFYVGINITEGA